MVPGLERGLKILTEFSPREPVLGAPELSKRLKIPRTTVFRLLQTLESLGFLERADKDRNYRLGVAVLRLGFEYLSSLELTDLGLPILEGLRDATGLTSHILIRDGRDVVFVAKAQSHAPIFSSVKVNVGTRLPAHATTHGHVLMGDLTLDELRALYPEKSLERFTKLTPETVEELYERVQRGCRARLSRSASRRSSAAFRSSRRRCATTRDASSPSSRRRSRAPKSTRRCSTAVSSTRCATRQANFRGG